MPLTPAQIIDLLGLPKEPRLDTGPFRELTRTRG